MNLTDKTFKLELCSWAPERGTKLLCLYLNDYRIAGGKPYGGAQVERTFKVSLSDLISACLDLRAMAKRAALCDQILAKFHATGMTINTDDLPALPPSVESWPGGARWVILNAAGTCWFYGTDEAPPSLTEKGALTGVANMGPNFFGTTVGSTHENPIRFSREEALALQEKYGYV